MPVEAVIAGAGESQYTRRPDGSVSTQISIARAARAALDDANLTPAEIDGLGVASFSLAPDRAIDVAVTLGLRVRWLMDGGTGGAAAIDMLQHARRAIEAGDARAILLVAGDIFSREAFRQLVDGYNVATRASLAGIPHGGPNTLFALLTRQQMERFGLVREDYGRIVIAQRARAAGNPNAIYRAPLTMSEYLAGRIVASPLTIFDCAPVVSGADAVVVTRSRRGARIRALRVLHNVDLHDGDGLTTGLAELARDLWIDAGAAPTDVDVASVYDDYPAMVVAQLVDLGFGDPREVVRLIASGELPVNTSGGQLSAGQAGAAGGMHGLVEVVRQLRHGSRGAGPEAPRLGLVTGYGMVAYRYGVCSNAVVLEAP